MKDKYACVFFYLGHGIGGKVAVLHQAFHLFSSIYEDIYKFWQDSLVNVRTRSGRDILCIIILKEEIFLVYNIES